MEKFSTYRVVMHSIVDRVLEVTVLNIYATTKWHALDKAYYEHPEGIQFMCRDARRTRTEHQIQAIYEKW